jgi:hypothetical protein
VIAQVSASNGDHSDVILPSGGLRHRGSSAGRLLVHPSFTLLGGPFFLVRSGSEESTAAVAPLTGCPATTPAYAAPTSAYLSCRPLDAACSLVEAVGLTTGPRAELPFACAGRCVDPAPDSGSGAGRRVAGSMEPLESDVSNSLALRFPAVARGTFWETEVSPPGRAGLAPTVLASGSFAQLFSLGGSLGLSPLLFRYYVPLQLSQGSRGQLV